MFEVNCNLNTILLLFNVHCIAPRGDRGEGSKIDRFLQQIIIDVAFVLLYTCLYMLHLIFIYTY